MTDRPHELRAEAIARPFEWTFTRADLDRVIERVGEPEPHLRLVA